MSFQNLIVDHVVVFSSLYVGSECCGMQMIEDDSFTEFYRHVIVIYPSSQVKAIFTSYLWSIENFSGPRRPCLPLSIVFTGEI
jgi:hypothetical protein